MLRMNPINLYLSVCARYIQVMLKSFGARISYWNSLLSFDVLESVVFTIYARGCESTFAGNLRASFCCNSVYVLLCGGVIYIKP